jgi:hypothetical protein
MTEATAARLAQIIKLSYRDDTHTCGQIRELAERALTDERGQARELQAITQFVGLKARQCADQAFGDSRVEDAGRAFEDVACMLERVGRSGADLVDQSPVSRHREG